MVGTEHAIGDDMETTTSHGYEDAPATLLVATHCAVCSRPLVDANSVEAGIGPECRKKHGYNEPCSDEARKAANHLVYRIAAEQDGPDVLHLVEMLAACGFQKLAARIAERLVKITLTVQGDRYVLEAPYSEEATTQFRRVPGRRWDKDANANTFPSTQKAALWGALKASYAGQRAKGPQGFFIIA